LDPAKGSEIGKLRPVAVLSAEEVLEVNSPLIFVCPLSSLSLVIIRPLVKTAA
jgi:mRNA interferase MazF